MAWMRALYAACCRALTPGTWSVCYALMVRINSIGAEMTLLSRLSNECL